MITRTPNLPVSIAGFAKGIDHVALAVPDLEAATVWYERTLGFEILGRRLTKGERTSMISAVLRSGPVTFVLTQGLEPSCQVSRFVEAYGAGVSHVAVRVDDLDAVSRALTARGTEFATTIIEGRGLRQLFTKRDRHSGMMLELIEDKGGAFTDQSVEALFRQLEANGHF